MEIEHKKSVYIKEDLIRMHFVINKSIDLTLISSIHTLSIYLVECEIEKYKNRFYHLIKTGLDKNKKNTINFNYINEIYKEEALILRTA